MQLDDQTVLLQTIKLSISLFDHLIVCKQMTDI